MDAQEKERRAKTNRIEITWVAWSDRKPYAHIMSAYLTHRQWFRFYDLMYREGLTVAYAYAWERGKFKRDIPSND